MPESPVGRSGATDGTIEVKMTTFLAQDIVEALQGTKSPYLKALSREIQTRLSEIRG